MLFLDTGKNLMTWKLLILDQILETILLWKDLVTLNNIMLKLFIFDQKT